MAITATIEEGKKDSSATVFGLWSNTLEREVSSAADLLAIDLIHGLAESYELLGLHEASVSLVTRMQRFGLDPQTLVPFMLDTLTRRSDLRRLGQAIQLVPNLQERPTALRRTLARALTLLNQVPQAANEWHGLLRSGEMEAADWPRLAKFMAEHGDVGDIGRALEDMRDSIRGPDEPLFIFCLLQSVCLRDPRRAQSVITSLPPDSIDDPELSFELALLAFRLGDWLRAEAAALHAKSLRPDWSLLDNALVAFAAFAGREFRGTRKIQVSPGVAKAFHDVASNLPPDAFAWGFIHQTEAGDITIDSAPPPADGAQMLELPESNDVAVTFSLLPVRHSGEPAHAGPFPNPLDVLCYVDWSVPHLMLQREEEAELLHSFVGVPGHRDWAWEEVSLEIADATTHTSIKRSKCGQLWDAVSEELERRAIEEDLT